MKLPVKSNGSNSAVIWINGRITIGGNAQIDVVDGGFQCGAGVFETMTAMGEIPFAFDRHMKRMALAAAAVGMRFPPVENVRDACGEILEAGGWERTRLRVMLTTGGAKMTGESGKADPSLVVLGWDCPFTSGPLKLASVPWVRNERSPIAGIKSTSYFENVLMRREAVSRGADEALLLNSRGEICEGAMSNVWYARDGVLHTPALSSGCLAGVTREILIEICNSLGMDVEESLESVEAIKNADEVFMTSSVSGIREVSHLDDRDFPHVPGHFTSLLQEAYLNLYKDLTCMKSANVPIKEE